MKPTGTIDYEALSQDAMRGVIAKILKATEQSGLPGDHHFYISFDTNAAGVSISKRLRQQYPDVMTIVLQHRFWDLAVSDTYFEVKLTFDSIPERLVIPYKSIKVFFDPSVRYALQFDAPDFDNTGSARAGPMVSVERPSERSLTPLEPASSVHNIDRKPARPELVPVDPKGVSHAPDNGPDNGAADNGPDNGADTAAGDDHDAENSILTHFPTASTASGHQAKDASEGTPDDDERHSTLAPASNASSETESDSVEDFDEDLDETADNVVVSLDAFRKK